jgi:hypothetical protein
MATIVTIVTTTITVSERTRRRLAGYKHGESTFDDVLNALMDRVPLEDLVAEQVDEHYRRLKDFQGVSAKEFKAKLRRR